LGAELLHAEPQDGRAERAVRGIVHDARHDPEEPLRGVRARRATLGAEERDEKDCGKQVAWAQSGWSIPRFGSMPIPIPIDTKGESAGVLRG
jgi:hypothetical protein